MVDVEVEEAVVVGGALVGLTSELAVLVGPLLDVGLVLVLVRVGAGGSSSVLVLAGDAEEDVAEDVNVDVDVEEGSCCSSVLLVGSSVCESSVEDVLGSCGCALELSVGSVALLDELELGSLPVADGCALLDGLLEERVFVLSEAEVSSSLSSLPLPDSSSSFPAPSFSPPSDCLLRRATATATETCSV